MKNDSNLRSFCCRGFDLRVNNAGISGLAIVARSSDNKRFLIQSRGVDKKVSESLPKLPVAINICNEMVIRFCPFCGIDLNDWIENNAEHFESLANDQRSLVLSD
jgi:hypothetical protein